MEAQSVLRNACILAALSVVATTSSAQKFQVLHSFGGALTAPVDPVTPLAVDHFGNLYGSSSVGGADTTDCGSGCGTMFALSEKNGRWLENTLYSFPSPQGDTNSTTGTMVISRQGVIYAVQNGGGNDPLCSCGTVYALVQNGGQWTQQILHSFAGSPDDGQSGSSGLIEDSVGNMYGTTSYGGTLGMGTVFELSPAAGGGWNYNVIYSFGANGGDQDGDVPGGPMAIDRSGNLYGATFSGGLYFEGTVFKLSPSESGWKESILFNFTVDSGSEPQPYGIVLGPSGSLYGITSTGGEYNVGTIYQLTPASGIWNRTVIYTFTGGRDGAFPFGAISVGANGAIYGTTTDGGAYSYGNIYELIQSHGTWKQIPLHQFSNGNDGGRPTLGVTMDPSGNLYGSTLVGGAFGFGTVFEITP